MGTTAAKSAATVVTPKVAKITKSDITSAILAQSDEVKIGLLGITANVENLSKFTKDSLVAIVAVANPKFEVLKKTTKGEIIPAIQKAEAEVLGNVVDVIFTEENLMKLTREVLDTIIGSVKVSVEEIPTQTDVVIVVESVDVVAEQTETEQETEQTEA
jgi:hypothetical protein